MAFTTSSHNRISGSSFTAHLFSPPNYYYCSFALIQPSISSQKYLFSRFAKHIPLLTTMGACLSVIINACNEIVRSAIPSNQLDTDSEEIDSSTVVLHSNPTTMASTSSSIVNASQPLVVCRKYDVFINHHGKDVKNSLASTIYHTLNSIGVRAFLDREELETGEEISDAINEAILSASVQIAIFSRNYAQSRWCLDELTLMLQTGKKMIPIFYHVEPSHLRWVSRGVYSQAFSKHEKDGRYTPQTLEEWKMALHKSSFLFGYQVNERQNDEGLLVKKIVNNVMEEMKNMPLLDVATHPVGLDEAEEEFQKFVENPSQCAQSIHNVKIVGIAGLGGCGKTTLVKEYFNRKRSFYPRSSFLFDVRDAAGNNRLHDLQRKLLEDLVHIKEAIHHRTEGKRTLEHRVRSVKALIVLDDVDHIDQIEALLPLKGNLHPDSLIVVTTRDSGVIESSASLSPALSVSVYRKRGLDPVHAKQLFCWHAFLQASPVKGFEDLVEEFLEACQGLPLSLKVLGGQLYGKNENYWKSQLHKISKIVPDDIKQRLKVSYDALDEEQQQMFLDIACFFIGEQKDTAISIWDGSGWDGFLWSGWHGFHILENKCLIEVDHDIRIRMHDHLRDLGRETAIKETPSRFWSHSQFVNSRRPLEERLPIRGIMAATGGYGYCNLHYEPPFEECMQLLMGHSTSRSKRLMPSALGLQLLVVRGDYLKEQFAKLSEELLWLRWYNFPHEKLPSWLSTEKLRVLELYGYTRLTELWGPNDAPPSQLRELIINMSDFCSLQMIPKTIGFLKHLKKIVLKGGAGQNETKSLPEEFCLLESLEYLELPNFSHLSSLPTDFGKLRKLKYINLRDCQRLTSLPVSFNQLAELEHLDLSGCENLQLEKIILENITKLEKLRLGGCSKLQQLPSEITSQMYLRELCLSRTGLRELPADNYRLAKLQVLEIGSDCLTSLPTSLVNLSSLIKLKIEDCPELKCLPSLGNLSSLIKLKIKDCGELTHLPHVGFLTRLENLKLQSSGVEYLPEGFRQLVNLQNLDIVDCPIRELPLANPEERYSMFKFQRLKFLCLHGSKVSTISISEECCPSLEDLDLSGNDDLMEIETLPTTLKCVQISYCEKLENIRGLAGLAELQNLEIHDCPIRELPLANPEEPYSKKPRLLNHVDSSMIKPQMLPRSKYIHLRRTKVSTISISEDCCFEELDLYENHDLMEIETLPTTLKRVQISTCEKLESIRGIAGVAELQYLTIMKCPGLDELPSFVGLVQLQRLVIKECPELDELPCFACCTCLEELMIEVSSRVTNIEGLEELRSLKTLRLETSWKVPGIERLKNLDKLTELQIRAESRSAIETCIPPNILKRPCRMEIVGRAVEDVESVVGSLSFPNFTVVDSVSFSFREYEWRWQMKSPLSKASCVIVCFVISCRSQERGIFCDVASAPSMPPRISLLDGKQVYIGVWPKGFDLNDHFMEGSEWVFLVLRGRLGIQIEIEIEKAMAVIMREGEEEKALEPLHKFLELLKR